MPISPVSPSPVQEAQAWAASPPLTVYAYDATRAYSGVTYAQPSPLEPGLYLLPANTTSSQPPSVGEGEITLFENGAWASYPDNRGQWFDGQGQAVEVSDPRQDTSALSRTAPPGEGYKRNLSGVWEIDEAAQAMIRASALDWARGQRSRILGVLDGMQASAITVALTNIDAVVQTNAKELASAIEVAKSALCDLPQTDLSGCLGAQACKQALQTQLDSIAAALPEDTRKAFA